MEGIFDMKRIHILLVAMCLLFLTGCGGDQQLDTFHDEMDNFYNSLSTAVVTLENIDPESETAVDDMLTQLDSLAVLFDSLAGMDYPDPFSNIQDTAVEASEYMTVAAELYHEAYADGYDDALAEAAGENYSRAMKRINYIAILLQGRYPEDENVTVISEPDEPDWNGGEEPVTEKSTEE